MSKERLILPGYTVLRLLHRGNTGVVYRAVSNADSSTVIVKTPTDGTQTAAARKALEREAGVLERLAFPGVPRMLALELGGQPALILEDLGGDTLAALLRENSLSLVARLHLARQLAGVLGMIHAHGIVHRDINPSNILVNADSLAGAIIDFGLAIPRSVTVQGEPTTELEGTPAYVSPEQTGRTGWGSDHRSDLYSFGVTLYELFTGRLPFVSDDPLKVVHAHLALEPDPPANVSPAVPPGLSAVILKLLAKNPSSRYQTAAGLSADLSLCLDGLGATGSVATFELGTHDVPERIALPEQLYGRDAEVAAIEAAFVRARETGGAFLLVAGYSGIGKTSLVLQLKGSVTRTGGRFVSGKFDQFVRGTPYTAIREAFVKLAQHLLGEPDDRVAEWRSTLLAALGTSGQVILDLLPEFEPILGPQPSLPALRPAEAQNRFNRIFGNFVRAFARSDQPLVLFLDDLQWVDAASLDLVRAIFAAGVPAGLLVVVAYRDNEVDPDHPLFHTIADIEHAGTKVSRLTLAPLDETALHHFVADTLRGSEAYAAPLAELIRDKTGGNPFFVGQFMKSMAQEQLLRPDASAGVWTYDLDGIKGQPSTDNVVELLAGRIEHLPQRSRDLLRVAACLGNRFDLDTLAVSWRHTDTQTAAALRPALLEGLLVEVRDEAQLASGDKVSGDRRAYRFLHDRVQQAAYALIPEADRPAAHIEIGRALLDALDREARLERAFELVDQIKPGLALVREGRERREVFELAVAAGHKARTATAYAESLEYFQAAAQVVAPDAWSSAYDETFDLHFSIAECEYLSGRFEDAFHSFTDLDARAANPLDGARVQILRASQYETMARYADAVSALRAGLAPLGIALPDTEQLQTALDAELDAVDEALGDRDIGGLFDLPPMDDPTVKMCMRLLSGAWAPSYLLADSRMISWLPARMVRLSLEHGNTEESALGYVTHGFTLGTRRGDYRRGQAFGLLGVKLNEALDDLPLRGKVHELFGCFVNLWRRPLAECIASQHTALLAGIEGGDFAYGSYGGFVETWYGFLTNARLTDLEQQFAPTLAFLRSIRNDSFAEAERLILNWAAALAGQTEAPDSLTGFGLSESTYRDTYRESEFFSLFLWGIKLHLHLTLGQLEKASVAAAEAGAVVHSLTGTIWTMLLRFYRSLAHLAAQPRTQPPGVTGPTWISEDVAQLGIWAENCPENFLHAHLLVRAELARLAGDDVAAEDLYTRAIEAARVRAFPGDLALANERFARYWLERGQRQIGSLFLLEALSAYDGWGAAPKAELLAGELSDLARRPQGSTDGEVRGSGLTSPASVLATLRSPGEALDLEWTLNAAGAIASEIELDKLLATLMRTLLECAGAERGCLVLTPEETARVRVRGDAVTGEIAVLDQPLAEGGILPLSVLRYVCRTARPLVLEDATADSAYAKDPYVAARKPRSVLCLPVLYQRKLLGAVYLENNLNSGAFTGGHQRVLTALSVHAAIAIRNAELFNEVAQLEERVRAENVYLQEEIKIGHGFEDIVGNSAALRKVLQRVEQVAPTDTTVLITGETGTGKELVARAIHNLSHRKDAPLITLNCGAIPSGVIESELFGHEKGAFTGAVARKIGRFELADRGTLFLDEIGDLAPDLQVKLLRVLQEGEFERVGGTKPIRVDVRVIAATHRALEQAVEAGGFRADLFYRLAVFPVPVPPLRERPDDIPQLARYFVQQFAGKLGKPVETIPRHTMDALRAYPWPGNVRELRNVIERSVIISPGIALELGDWIARTNPVPDGATEPRTLEEVERTYILSILQRTGWRVSGTAGAARILGLKPTTLEARMKKLAIIRPGVSVPNIS